MEHLKHFWARYAVLFTIIGAIPATIAGWTMFAELMPWVTEAQAAEELRKVEEQWRRSADEIILQINPIANTLKKISADVGKNSAEIKNIKAAGAIAAYDRACDRAAGVKEKANRIPQYYVERLDRSYRIVLTYDSHFPKCTVHEGVAR